MKATYIDHMGSDLSVVNAARVSFGKVSEGEYLCEACGARASFPGELECTRPPCDYILPVAVPTERDEKLIKYLAKHKHTSPFNHTFITMHMKAPIFVARQLVKHKFMPWNEISRRYVDATPEFYFPDEWREKADDKKQGSAGKFRDSSKADKILKRLLLEGEKAYEEFISSRLCPEQARMILPQNTYTEWYWSGTLGAWSDMYNLRSKPDTQEETRKVVLQCGNILEELFPVSWTALTSKNG